MWNRLVWDWDGDIDILSEEEDCKGALANYNAALTCSEELKEMYNKIGDTIFS